MECPKTNLLDLPVDIFLYVADFLPKGSQVALGLTCRGAWEYFEAQSKNLNRQEKKRLLLALQKEYPRSIICQNDLIIKNKGFCIDEAEDPRDKFSKLYLLKEFFSIYRHVSACVPVPAIDVRRPLPEFVLSYEHVNKVMLRHRLGPEFGMSLEKLSFSTMVVLDLDYYFDVKVAFRIVKNKLYMHGQYTHKSSELLSSLAVVPFKIDICPHIHLEHNRRPPRTRGTRKAVRLPSTAGCEQANSCYCSSNGTFDPDWTHYPHRGIYKSEMKSCEHCPTDVLMEFDESSATQTFTVDFWRCLGNGIYEEDDADWLLGSLNNKNEYGQLFRIPGKKLVKGETVKMFRLGSPDGGSGEQREDGDGEDGCVECQLALPLDDVDFGRGRTMKRVVPCFRLLLEW